MAIVARVCSSGSRLCTFSTVEDIIVVVHVCGVVQVTDFLTC